MKKYNVIIVFDEKEENVLMCKRAKEPYLGKYNLVGGKVEEGEDLLSAAYRELQEETGITKDDIQLKNLMNFEYTMQNFELEVYAGKLKRPVELVEEANKLDWINRNENFFDYERFAGEGNIGHMMMQTEIHRQKLFNEE